MQCISYLAFPIHACSAVIPVQVCPAVFAIHNLIFRCLLVLVCTPAYLLNHTLSSLPISLTIACPPTLLLDTGLSSWIHTCLLTRFHHLPSCLYPSSAHTHTLYINAFGFFQSPILNRRADQSLFVLRLAGMSSPRKKVIWKGQVQFHHWNKGTAWMFAISSDAAKLTWWSSSVIYWGERLHHLQLLLSCAYANTAKSACIWLVFRP